MLRRSLKIALTAAGLATALPVAALERVALEPITHATASLTVMGPAETQTFTPSELEALGAMRVVTTTPWRENETTFDGVLLQDLLAATGISDAKGIRVIAENDFAIEMPRAVWESTPILIATRVEGRAFAARAGTYPVHYSDGPLFE